MILDLGKMFITFTDNVYLYLSMRILSTLKVIDSTSALEVESTNILPYLLYILVPWMSIVHTYKFSTDFHLCNISATIVLVISTIIFIK